MSGIKALRRIQLGAEITPGTATAASTIWRGLGTIEDTQVMEFPEEDVGLMAPTHRSYISQYGGQLTMDAVPATFEQVGYLFEGGIKSVKTGTADGDGTGKIYTYPMPTTSDHTITTYTIEGGDNQQAEEMAHCFVESFDLEGNAGEALTMAATWIGRQVTTCSFTGSVSIPPVEEILVSKGKIYIDTAGASFGTTQVSKTIEHIAIHGVTGLKGRSKIDGSKYYVLTSRDGGAMEATMELRFEHNSTAAAQKEAWRSESAKKIRACFQGSALNTAGTTYTYATLQVDMLGKWESFSSLDEEDGDNVVTGTFRAGADTAGTDYATFVVVNELAALP